MSVYVENKIHNNLTECLPDYKTNFSYSRFSALAKQSIKKIAYWKERSTQRKELAALDDRMLEDIGLSPFEAQKEISKPFWR